MIDFQHYKEELKKLQPHWFREERAAEIELSKLAISDMSSKGLPRPSHTDQGNYVFNGVKISKRKIGITLRNLISYQSRSARKGLIHHGTAFLEKLRKESPDWFRTVRKTVDELKEYIRCTIRKPSPRDPLYKVIWGRMEKHPDFALFVRRARPTWFLTSRQVMADKVATEKKEIVSIARKGGSKPKRGSRLYVRLTISRCRTSHMYDLKFAKHIEKLRPDWFPTVELRIKSLLRMAASGKRPVHTSKEAAFLRYIKSKPLNVKYKGIIRRLNHIRPDWFVHRSQLDKADRISLLTKSVSNGKVLKKADRDFLSKQCRENPKVARDIQRISPLFKKNWKRKSYRQAIIKMIDSGKERPKQTTHLGSWVNRELRFDKKLREYANKYCPNWFRHGGHHRHEFTIGQRSGCRSYQGEAGAKGKLRMIKCRCENSGALMIITPALFWLYNKQCRHSRTM
jgi:hypothetical protein